MGFFAKQFLPLFGVLAGLGLWLLTEYDHGRIFAIAPPANGTYDLGALAPAAGAPATGVSGREARPAPGRPLRDRHAGDFDQRDKRPRIAIEVTGLGLGRGVTPRAIEELSPVVTLAFSPDGDDLSALAKRARKCGHEILIDAPTEPADASGRDAGPGAFRMKMSAPHPLRRLTWMQERVPYHVGLIGALGDGFAREDSSLKPLLAALTSHGLIYVDNRPEAAVPASPHALPIRSTELPTATVHVWLDRTHSAAAIDRELAAAAGLAREHGRSVAVAEAYPLSLARIAAWMKAFDSASLAAAPISAVARGGS